MDEFLPYSRLVDRLAYEYELSGRIYWAIINRMGWYNDGMRQFTGYKKHAKAYEIEKKLGSPTFGSYYKFAFVRNPFDWLVSLYSYLLQDEKHFMHGAVSSKSFSEFLKWLISQNPDHQINFLMDLDRNRRLVDYIGRFETLEKDVNSIQRNLNLKISDHIEHKNVSPIRKNRDYKDYYDSESRGRVLSHFRSDFEMLGYDFNGFHENIPLMQQF